MPTFHRGSLCSGSPHLFIAAPFRKGDVCANFVGSLLRSVLPLREAGIGADYCLLEGDPHVDDARNSLVNQFIRTDCTHLMFIDADVGWEADDLVKMARHDRDLVGGVYPLKQMATDFPVRVKPGTALQADLDGLVEVDGLPTGFLKISRQAIDALIAAEPKKYYGRGQRPDGFPRSILFERTYESEDSAQHGRRFGGDYAFCNKWVRLGGKMYVDPEMTFSHEGSHLYTGQLGDFWRRKHGVYAVQAQAGMDKAVETLRGGELTGRALADLYIGWDNGSAATGELMAAAWEVARNATWPILECGSGVSTLVMALANPGIRVDALEASTVWADKLQRAIERYEIDNIRIEQCRLTPHESGVWYDFEPDGYEVVLCDGPWRGDGDRHVLFAKINGATGTLIADDADDPNFLPHLRQWASDQGKTLHMLGEQRKFAVVR